MGRYAVAGIVQRRARSGFPVGTLAVNLTGALALGVLVGAGVDGGAVAGFLGGYTTFSTWMAESVTAPTRRGVLNIVVTLAGGLIAAYLGSKLGGIV